MISAKKGEIVTLSLMLINTNRAMGVELYMDYNKDYLTGRYGAIPVLEEFDIIWETKNIQEKAN